MTFHRYRTETEEEATDRQVAELRAMVVRSDIVAAIEAMGHTVKTRGRYIILDATEGEDGENAVAHFEITLDRPSRHVYPFKPRRLRAKLGGVGRIQQFPEPKIGFDIKKLAALIAEEALDAKRMIESEARNHDLRNAVQEQAERVQKAWDAECGYTGPFHEGRFGTVREDNRHLKVDLRVYPTEKQALAILRAVRDIMATDEKGES